MGKCVEGGAIREGSWYWVRDSTTQNAKDSALVVMCTWTFSKRRYHMPYVHMFNEFGWECLVCQPHFLNLWSPSRAFTLAMKLLDEIAEELRRRPRPVCFVSFSGGTKACSYMMIQILQGKCEGFECDMKKYEFVRECAAGYIFDSTPVNFVSETGVLFFKRMLGTSLGGNIATKFVLQSTAKALDSMFRSEWQAQEIQFQNALVAAVEMAPVLFLCSRNDKLVPFELVEQFCSEMKDRGSITLVYWEESDHVAHLRHHREEYTKAVCEFLARIQQAGMEAPDLQTPGLVSVQHDKPKSAADVPQTVRLNQVAHMIADDVYDLQHDFQAEFLKKNIILAFPQMRSRL